MNDATRISELVTDRDQLPQSIEDYVQGSCHVFAQAMAEEFGYEMEAIWDMCPLDDELNEGSMPTLVHAYCRTPDGKLIDASGVITHEDASESHGEVNEAMTGPLSMKNLKSKIKRRLLHSPMNGEIKALRKFLHKNKDAFHADPENP